MAFADLRDFVALLDARGRLRRVTVRVDPELEISEITDRVSKAPATANVALLFEHVAGASMPLLINAFGAPDRMAWALGVERLDELGERVAKLLDLRMPGTFAERLRKLGTLFDVARAGPRRVTDAPCQEVVETRAPSLADIPVLRCWPGDAGRFITLPAVFTRDPVTGARNVGMYRLQVFDERTLGMHWQTHKGSAEHHRAAERGGGDRMPVAIVLGGDPAMIYAASAPLPPGVDEVVFAGWLRGRGVELVRCRTVDLEVPAQAEIVLEGWVDPRERRLEGPFGDHTGYYSLAREYPVFHLTAVTRRARPIYATTIVGRPPQEDYWLGKATERVFLPIMKLMLPEIVDVNMPAEGVFHNLVIVSIVTLVANLLQIEDLPETVRALILKKSEGNPFFVEEVLKALIERGSVRRESGHWHRCDMEELLIPQSVPIRMSVCGMGGHDSPGSVRCHGQRGDSPGRHDQPGAREVEVANVAQVWRLEHHTQRFGFAFECQDAGVPQQRRGGHGSGRQQLQLRLAAEEGLADTRQAPRPRLPHQVALNGDRPHLE